MTAPPPPPTFASLRADTGVVMASRILSFLLGALLTATGWAIVDPKGLVGVKLPGLEQLGAFEGHRIFIGWGAVALGVVALLAAVLPRDGGPNKAKRRGPPVVDFDAEPPPPPVSEDAEPALAMGRPPSPSSLW